MLVVAVFISLFFLANGHNIERMEMAVKCVARNYEKELCDTGFDILNPVYASYRGFFDVRGKLGCASVCPGRRARFYYNTPWSSEHAKDGEPGSLEALRTFLNKASLGKEAALLHGGLVMFILWDDCTLPLPVKQLLFDKGLTWLRHAGQNSVSPYEVELPNFHYLITEGFTKAVHIIKEGFPDFTSTVIPDDNTPLKSRQKGVFWRGTDTIWKKDNVRWDLTRATRDLSRAHPDMNVNAKLTMTHAMHFNSSAPPDPVAVREGLFEAYSAANAGELVWSRYRGIFDVDGFVDAWGLFWRLKSGSVVYKVETDFPNGFTSNLIPWKHYIPVFRNFSNLKNVTELAHSDNPAVLEYLSEIARNAREYVERLTYEARHRTFVQDLNIALMKAHPIRNQ